VHPGVTRTRSSAGKSRSVRRPEATARSSGSLDPANIRATQAIYAASMLEEGQLFQVADRVAEQFQCGALPIGRGRARSPLPRYTGAGARRRSTDERLALYARTLGVAGGEAGGRSNREFADLWARFLSSVAALSPPSSGTVPAVRRSGRDLAANLSAHGKGPARHAVRELTAHIGRATALLSARGVRSAFDARDVWQVVDQVSALELGGAKNSARYRAMAEAGSRIIAWLARRSRDLDRSSPFALKMGRRSPRPRAGTARPSDAELVAACKAWRAAADTA
jgi:hypothetical protein